MSKIISFAKTIRRNWKKSTVFFGILAYGASYGAEKYRTFQMMRAYCEEAKKYGESPLPQLSKPRHVTVILNPKANDEKCNVQFEKFAAPLLHLAGFKVSVFQTESEKQASHLMEVMSNTDAVIIAGGDGTVQEVVTGLLCRPNVESLKIPLGVVPLGKTNTVAKHLFGSKSASNSQLIAEAVMAIIKNETTTLDVLKVQYTDENKPIYAVCNFEHGVFGDVEQIVSKYWYLGSLKDKYAYFRHSLKSWKATEDVDMQYVAACEGCSKCFVPPQQKAQGTRRWWHTFVPKSSEQDTYVDRSKVVNEDCGKQIPLSNSFSDLSILTQAAGPRGKNFSGALWIKIFPPQLTISEFVSAGLKHRNQKLENSSNNANVVQARQLLLVFSDRNEEANENSITEQFSFIDNEKYKKSSCSISLLQNQITVYGQ